MSVLDEIAGKAKQILGRGANDPQLRREGRRQEKKGEVKQQAARAEERAEQKAAQATRLEQES